MAETTVADLVRRVLAGAGVHAAYGRTTARIPVVAIADPDVAVTVSRAHQVVHGVGAAAILEGGIVRIPGAGTGPTQRIVVRDAEGLHAVVPQVARALLGGGLEMRLDLDLDGPAPDMAPAAQAEAGRSGPDESEVEQLARASSVVVLAGPGVVRQRAVPGLHAFATAGCLGVINTWGAKGIFAWRSQHHWATVGLQEQDFALAGLDQADLVVAVGLDEREAPARLWRVFPHLVVRPEDLGALAERWRGQPRPLEMPPLRARLAAVTQAGWSSGSVPLQPSRVTMHYGRRLAGGGLVAADAGPAGYWVARTYATTELGGASVPPARLPGWAVACVLVARVAAPMRPALAVVSDVVDDHSRSVLDAAAGLGIAVGVEVWSPDGDVIGPDDHLARLSMLVDSRVGGVATLATDGHQLDEMVEAAGPLRAWREER